MTNVIHVNFRPTDDDSYFGSCPDCEFGSCPDCGGFEYLNIQSDHWFFCDEHRICWLAGNNLFSSWHEESVEDWIGNAKKLNGYRVAGLDGTFDGDSLVEWLSL